MKKLLYLLLFLLWACTTRGPLESRVLQGKVGEVDVIVFSSTDCPIANAMAPEIERIHQTVQSNGGDLFLVHVWEGRTYKDATVHAKEYGLTMEILVDSEHELPPGKDNNRSLMKKFVLDFNQNLQCGFI